MAEKELRHSAEEHDRTELDVESSELENASDDLLHTDSAEEHVRSDHDDESEEEIASDDLPHNDSAEEHVRSDHDDESEDGHTSDENEDYTESSPAFLEHQHPLLYWIWTDLLREASSFRDGSAQEHVQFDYDFESEEEYLYSDEEEEEDAASSAAPAVPVETIVVSESTEWRMCMICLEDIEVGEEAAVLSCSHKFHEPCISPWSARKRTCPCCRRQC